MTNPFNLWLADFLGIYVGFVIVLETILAIGLFWLFIWLLFHLVFFIQDKYEESEGLEAFGWLLLLIVPALLLLFINWIFAIITIATVASFLSGSNNRRQYHRRDW